MRALLTDRPRRRDLLIEHLHLIQDHYGHLSAAHLAALAAEMKLALTEVYEVATFYSHFDVVKDGPPPPAVTVRVCDSLSCAMAGAEKLLAQLPGKLGKDVRVVRAPCMGACDRAPVVRRRPRADLQGDARQGGGVGDRPSRMRMPGQPGADFAAYQKAGGYALLKSCLDGKRTRDELIKIVSDCRPARSRRRRLSDRAQMAIGARGARARACSRSMPTRASPAPSRTAIISSATRTASSRAC